MFTKVARVLIKYWRASGIRIFGYVDDVSVEGIFSYRVTPKKVLLFDQA